MQDLHTAGFTIETPVHGDVTIGIWLGGHKRDRDVPALAYQFHTAMLDSNQVSEVAGQYTSDTRHLGLMPQKALLLVLCKAVTYTSLGCTA